MTCNIKDYGASEAQLNTAAIQTAIDTCHRNGGGRVLIPAGRFVTGTLWLRSHVELHLEQGAVLKASGDLSDYNETDAYPQNRDCPSEGWCGKHLIIALQCEDVAITGTGVIEGNTCFYGGPLHLVSNFVWRAGYIEIAEDAPLRPGQLICFVECQHITVRDITLRETTCWALWLWGCDWCSVSGVRIYNDPTHENTDGIDVDCCSHVTVSDCIIDTGDDAIAIRGSTGALTNAPKPCEYVTVSNCVLSSASSAVRLGIGPGCVRHISMSDLVIPRAGVGFTFNTQWKGRSPVPVTDIHISHVDAVDVGFPFDISTEGVEIGRVYISDFVSGCKGHATVSGGSGADIHDLVLRDVVLRDMEPGEAVLPDRLESERGEHLLTMCNARNVSLENVELVVGARKGIRTDNTVLRKNEVFVVEA